MSSAHVDEKVAKQVSYIGIAFMFILLFSTYPELKQMGLLGKPDPVQEEFKKEENIYYKVTKVTDGDTIHIDADGQDDRVRLLGINTPEVDTYGGKGQCYGKESASYLNDILLGKMVRLETDPTQDLRDTYGRVLAYVYLKDGEMANRRMIAEGYAYEYTYLKPYRYQKQFKQLQTFARVSGHGLWATSTCRGLK